MSSSVGNEFQMVPWVQLNTGSQLQTFLNPVVSKAFPYSNAMMMKSLAHSSIQKHDRQTKKHQTFSSPGGMQSLSPTILGMVLKEVCTSLAPWQYFHICRIVLPVVALKIWKKMHSLWLNPHNSGTPWVNPLKFKWVAPGGTAHKPWKFRKNHAIDTTLRGICVPKLHKFFIFQGPCTPAPIVVKFGANVSIFNWNWPSFYSCMPIVTPSMQHVVSGGSKMSKLPPEWFKDQCISCAHSPGNSSNCRLFYCRWCSNVWWKCLVFLACQTVSVLAEHCLAVLDTCQSDSREVTQDTHV